MSSTAPGGRPETVAGGNAFASGVTLFAGVLLVVVAAFQVLEGIAAIANDTVFVRGFDYVWKFDVTAWGWIHLIVGLLGVATGVGILMGQAWAWVVGIAIAGISALTNFMFMPYYPFWSLAVIGIDILVIWALCRQIAGDRVGATPAL
jgi:hypothetical protein